MVNISEDQAAFLVRADEIVCQPWCWRQWCSLQYWYISSRLCGIIPEDHFGKLNFTLLKFLDLCTMISGFNHSHTVSLPALLPGALPSLGLRNLLRSFCSFLIFHSCTHIAKVSIIDFNYFVCSTLRPVVQFMKCQWQWKRTQRTHNSLSLWVMASSSLRRGPTVRKLWRPFNILS